MSKHPLRHLGGLVVSFSSAAAAGGGGDSSSQQGDEERDSNLALKLEAAVLLLLQYDGEPLELCKDIWAQTSSEESADETTNGRVPCLVAYALKTQVLASIRIIEDLGPITKVLADPHRRSQYEPWEQAHFALVVDFATSFDVRRISSSCRDHMKQYPADIFTLRLMFVCALLAGDMAPFAELSDGSPLLLSCVEGNLAKPFVQSWMAFAFEEAGDLVTAEAMNSQALRDVDRFNADKVSVAPQFFTRWVHPFAVHVVCHVFETRHDPAGGLAAVEAIPSELWANTAFLIVHLYWHLALFNLDCGNEAASLEIYDKHIAPKLVKEDVFSLSDATALLARVALLHEKKTRPVEEASFSPPPPPPPVAASGTSNGESRVSELDVLWAFHCDDTGRLGRLTDCNFFALHLVVSAWLSSSSSGRLLLPSTFGSRSEIVGLIRRMLLDGDGAALLELRDRRGNWKEVGGSNAQRDLIRRLAERQ